MKSLFDKNSNFRQVLNDRSEDASHDLLNSWLKHRVTNIPQAAGAADAMLVDSTCPENAITELDDPSEPHLELIDDGAKLEIKTFLQAKAECLILFMTRNSLELIEKRLGNGSGYSNKKKTAKLLFQDNSVKNNFHRDLFLSGLPNVQATTDDRGNLNVEKPVPEGFSWTPEILVVVYYRYI